MDKNNFAVRNKKQPIIDILKRLILKWRYKAHLFLGENVLILGKLPILKVPKEGKIVLGDNVTLNSDFINSNTFV